ncbi:hypothetical protein SLA2020_355320 [Shorea laevis]
MGCTASKLDNVDSVRPCKERRRLMEEAVYACHHLAAAHANYCCSLRLMGSALSSFAAGEPLPVSDQTPAVLLRSPSSHPSYVHPVSPSPSPSLHSSPPPLHWAPASSHKSLKEIADAIKENFDKAAAAGDQVSRMLEIGQAQFDRSFRQLKKTVYHSSSVFSNLSSRWTSKPPLALKYGLDTAAVDETRGSKSLCSTLYELLAWENKHCGEVMAREVAKIEHDKKLLALQSQEYKGGNETKLDKTKASIKRLHSLIIVNSQAVFTTSTSIIGLRDSDLVPQLVELCHGFMYMWRSMRQYHEVQNHIVQQAATHDLESAVSAWHSSFCRLIKFQRDFIRSLHGWFGLTLIPVSNDNVDGNGQPSTVSAFINQWKLALDQVPDTVASEAIKSFIKAVHDISVKQTEEHRIKSELKHYRRSLRRKLQPFET